MNTGTTIYRSPDRDQLINERHHREELHDRLRGAMEKIHVIELAATDKVKDDPKECVDDLKVKVDKLFTEIPDEYRTKESMKKKKADENVQSRIANDIKNPEYDAAVSQRSKKPQVKNAHEAVVSSKTPLPLSWDASRALTGKGPAFTENKAVSHYAGISTAGPMAVPEENPRKKVQGKKEAVNSKFIPLDKTRKAKLLEVKPRPTPGKMAADFVPTCAAHDAADGKAKRQEVAQKNDSKKGALVGDKHFH